MKQVDTLNSHTRVIQRMQTHSLRLCSMKDGPLIEQEQKLKWQILSQQRKRFWMQDL